MEIYKKDVFKLVVSMDTFTIKFRLLRNYNPMALLSGAGVPHKEYALQSLSVGGMTETMLFCKDPHKIEKFMKESEGLWKYVMDIQVKSSDSCKSINVMREIDAASLVKRGFIHFGIKTTNLHFASLLEQFMRSVKKDKGAAMMLVLKELFPEHSLIKLEKSLFLAPGNKTKKFLVHDKYKQTSKKRTVTLPTKHLLSNAEVIMHHNLVDSNIAVCSPSVLPLFGDNLDFQTLDIFFRGLFIRLDMSTDSLYFTLLKANQYVAYLTNWNTHKTNRFDMLHHYLFGAYKEFKYSTCWSALRNKTADVNRSCRFGGDSILGDKCDNTLVSKSIIDNNVIIGNNVNSIIDKADIKNIEKIINSSFDWECSIEEACLIEGGAVVAQKLKMQPETKLNCSILEELDSEEESISESGTGSENESVGSEDSFIGLDNLSCFSSNFTEEFSIPSSPVPNDTDKFLGEVIESLARGFEDRLQCDYLISEINASRNAYHIQLHELNFFVVRALLSLPHFAQTRNVLALLREVITFFRPIFLNYIQCKSSVMDCLKAVEESCLQFEWLKGICSYVLHMLYDADIVDKFYLLEFYDYVMENDSRLLQYDSVTMFFEWIQELEE